MPLVRIDVVEGRSDAELNTLADTVYDVLRAVFNAPEGDRYVIIHEHRPGRISLGTTGLPITRGDSPVVIQITQQGRSRDQKTALYAELAARLKSAISLDPDDLVISLTTNTPEDWSFAAGRAQFLTGELPKP